MSSQVQKSPPLSARLQWTVWSLLAVVILVIAVLFTQGRSKPRMAGYPVLSELKPFSLTNQLGEPIGLQNLEGQVWIANIIFTRCAGPCPRLTEFMASIQRDLQGTGGIRSVTLTTDPEFDTPQVLKKYGDRFKAEPGHWWFLTGTKSEIAGLARDGLKLTAVEKNPGERDSDVDLFIHSTIFVLVDKHGRVRASFETDEPSSKTHIIEAVKQLLTES